MAKYPSHKAWALQADWKKRPIPTMNEFYKQIAYIDCPKTKALASMLYLTASRISEAVQKKYLKSVTFMKKQIKTAEGYVLKTYAVKDKKGNYIIQEENIIEIDYKGIRPKDIDFDFEKINGKKVRIMNINLANRKNRNIKFKRIPIPVMEFDVRGHKKKHDTFLVKNILNFANGIDQDQPIFNFGDRWARELIRRGLGMNPHYIRDIRLSHLVIYYGFTEQQLVKYAGWTDGRPAARYIRLRTKDIIPIRMG
jgi:hypothetical protein